MKKIFKYKISHYLEYYIFLVIFFFIRITPLILILYFAKYFAIVLGFFVKVRNKIVMENLDLAFPEKSFKEKKKIQNKMYQNILMSSFESLKYMYLSHEDKLKNFIIDQKSKNILDDIEKAGTGAVVVGGHYGFFEGGGIYAAAIGKKAAFVVANQKNKLTEKLIDVPRENNNILVIHRKNMMKLFKALKNGYFVALLMDQNAAGKVAKVFVDFFGKKAATHKNPAILALRYKLPLVYVSVTRDNENIKKHHMKLEKIDTEALTCGVADNDLKAELLVKEYTRMLEETIKDDPRHYWWIHKRYKTRPPSTSKNENSGVTTK